MSGKSITVAVQDGQVIIRIVPIDVTLNLDLEAAIRFRDDINKAIWILNPPNVDRDDVH